MTRSTWTLAGSRAPPAGATLRGLTARPALVPAPLPRWVSAATAAGPPEPGPPRGGRGPESRGRRRWPGCAARDGPGRGTEDARAAAPEAAETGSRKGRRALALERAGFQFQERTSVFCLLLGTRYGDRFWPGKGKLAVFWDRVKFCERVTGHGWTQRAGQKLE